MSRIIIELGDEIETDDGRRGIALEIHPNWVLVALETGGTDTINRAHIASSRRPNNADAFDDPAELPEMRRDK